MSCFITITRDNPGNKSEGKSEDGQGMKDMTETETLILISRGGGLALKYQTQS